MLGLFVVSTYAAIGMFVFFSFRVLAPLANYFMRKAGGGTWLRDPHGAALLAGFLWPLAVPLFFVGFCAHLAHAYVASVVCRWEYKGRK